VNRRRDLLIVFGAAAVAPGVLRAQAPAQVRRIGILSHVAPPDAAPWHEGLRQGLRDLGWVEGKNILIDYRYAEGKIERLPHLAADLVRIKVDVILASVLTTATAAQKATRAVPIVVAAGGDIVAAGLAESLTRPGGNVTGISQMAQDLGGKRLELLKEIIPRLSRVAVLWNPQGTGSTLTWKEIQLPARALGLQLHSLEVRSPEDFDKAFEEATRARAGALLILGAGVITMNLKRITDLAARNRLPSMFQHLEIGDAGGLVGYGPDNADMYRRAADYVDKILKGAKPGDLPIDRATKFKLVINMKTARALGLTIPQSILVRADRVIE